MSDLSGKGTSLRYWLIASLVTFLFAFVLADFVSLYRGALGLIVVMLFFASCFAATILAIIYLTRFQEKALATVSLILGLVFLCVGLLHWVFKVLF